jgi:hypothetical protein
MLPTRQYQCMSHRAEGEQTGAKPHGDLDAELGGFTRTRVGADQPVGSQPGDRKGTVIHCACTPLLGPPGPTSALVVGVDPRGRDSLSGQSFLPQTSVDLDFLPNENAKSTLERFLSRGWSSMPRAIILGLAGAV